MGLSSHSSPGLTALWLGTTLLALRAPAGAAPFIRGDANQDGLVELSDAVTVFTHLFNGSPAALACEDAADADDNGALEITDGIRILGYLYLGERRPPAPFPRAGFDGTTRDPFPCGDVVGGDRPVQVFAPRDYDPAEPLPLILLLHGSSNSGFDGAAREGVVKLRALIDSHRFLYAYPRSTTSPDGWLDWNAGDDFAVLFNVTADDTDYLARVIADVGRHNAVDARRVYLVGFSSGGRMCYRMACHRPDLIAGIVSVSGPQMADPSLACVPASPVHVLQIHGTADSIVRYTGGSVRGHAHPGAEEASRQWAVHNGCTGEREDTGDRLDLDAGLAGAEARVSRHVGCPEAGAVELWTVVGGEHGLGNPTASGATTRFAEHVVDWLLSHTRE